MVNQKDSELTYGLATLEQIREEIESLNKYLFEETRVYYDEQFLAGNYGIVTGPRQDGSFKVDVDVGDDLAAWRVLPSRQLAKVTLPREGFEKAYEALSQIVLLLNEEKERLEALAPETQ